MIAPTWNDVFEFPDSSYPVSDIQNYIEYIIKKHEMFPPYYPPPPLIYSNYIQIYNNWISNQNKRWM